LVLGLGQAGVDVDEVCVFKPLFGIGFQLHEPACCARVDGDALAATIARSSSWRIT
jgi:hypothetical protein